MPEFLTERAVARVSASALRDNFRALAGFAEGHAQAGHAPRIIAVVKANAYGHGIKLAVPALLRGGCTFFAVATLNEALAVRRLAPGADILILGYTPPSRAKALAQNALTQTVFSREYAMALAKSATVSGVLVKTHLKIDGGMCRLGFSPWALEDILFAATAPHLKTEGIYTHFPCADTDIEGTRDAFSRFLACRAALSARGFTLFAHAAASAALLRAPETLLDGARVGLALYGIPPVATALPLRRALELTAPIVQIREVAAGTPVGYGGTFVTARPARIGTLPIGYGDGVSRRFGKTVKTVRVWCGNTAFSAPVAGNICMDQMMIDLTNTPAKVGDRAELFEDITRAASALDTIPYELLTCIGERVVRKRVK